MTDLTNQPQPTPRPPFPRWGWVLVVVTVVALIVTGTILWVRQHETARPEPTAAADPTPTRTGDPDVVTGCLAEGQDINMLLTTQNHASHTEAGAVEFATAQLRWMKQWPWATFEDFEKANSKTWAGGSIDRAQYEAMVSGPNASSGIVPEDTPFHLTAAIGRWHVDAYDGARAQVTVGAGFVVGDAVSPVYRSLGTYNLEWTRDGWVTTSTEKKHTVYELFDEGLGAPYEAGC